MREPMVNRLLRLSLYAVFIFGTVFTLTLPFMLNLYTRYIYDFYLPVPGYRPFILTFLIIVGTLVLWAVAEMILLTRTVRLGPFTFKNVRALKRIGLDAVLISALFFVKCVFYITYLTLVCAAIFLMGALFAFTLASLFRQAAELKEENELTI